MKLLVNLDSVSRVYVGIHFCPLQHLLLLSDSILSSVKLNSRTIITFHVKHTCDSLNIIGVHKITGMALLESLAL